jgi:hypothetical protein
MIRGPNNTKIVQNMVAMAITLDELVDGYNFEDDHCMHFIKEEWKEVYQMVVQFIVPAFCGARCLMTVMILEISRRRRPDTLIHSLIVLPLQQQYC